MNVTIEMDVEPWGETVSEDLSVDQRKFVDTLTVKLLMETGSPEDLRQVRALNMHFLKMMVKPMNFQSMLIVGIRKL